jgi:hypothetical protein
MTINNIAEQITNQKIFEKFSNILEISKKNPVARKAVLIGISNQLRRLGKKTSPDFKEVAPHLQTLLTKLTREELDGIIKIITDIYLQQRASLKGGNTAIEVNGRSYGIWIDSQRPQTDIEQVIFEWLGNGKYPIAQQAGLEARLNFDSELDQIEEKRIKEIKAQSTSRKDNAHPELNQIVTAQPRSFALDKIIANCVTIFAKPYRPVICNVLPEAFEQNKSRSDLMNFELDRWQENPHRSLASNLQLGIFSNRLRWGLRLAENRLWIAGLSLVVAGIVAVSLNSLNQYISNLPKPAPQKTTSVDNPPAPDTTGILVVPGVIVSDMDSANFDTGQLTVQFTPNATPDDRLSIRDRGKNPGEIGVDGNNITYGGMAIGSFQGGEGTVPLTVTFNDKSRPEHAQALMRSIVYQNISNNPVIGSRTVQFQLNDGGENGTSKAIAQIINVTTENQAPVLTVPNNKTVKENAILIITDISISDSDGQNITVTMSVTNGILTVKTDVAQGVTANNISGNQTQTITLKGIASQINTTLANTAAVTYRGDPDFSGNDELTITANDGGKTPTGIAKKSLVWPPDALSSKTDKKSLNITVTPLNAPPVVTVPDRTIAKENTNLIISGISISDPDTQNLTVTMSVTNGILTVKGDVVQGLIAQNITGNKTKTVTFKGTIAQINTTLAKAAGVIYLGNKNFSGKDSLNITVSDNGKKPESKTINIIVNPMNRPPQLTIAEVVTVGENTITQTEAVTLIKSWLQAKGEAYIPPFNPEVIARYTTGEYYKKSIGSVDWLKNNNAYYKYESPTVEPTGKFSMEGERVTIEMIVKENPTLFVNERVDPTSSGPSTGMYRFTLQFDSGTWKIADTQKID